MKVVRMQILGGKASPAPPLGPALSQYGLPVDKVVAEINKLTEGYLATEVTVVLEIDEPTGKYTIKVKSPTTTSLLLKYAKVQEPSGDPAHKKVGSITLDDAIRIALAKKSDINAKTLKAAVKSVVSTARSIGLTVNGKDPKEVLAEINRGIYDDLFSKYEEQWRGGVGASN
ncbi:MAG: 50S ribosomal protein L11 [Sulfolobales archaeon]